MCLGDDCVGKGAAVCAANPSGMGKRNPPVTLNLKAWFGLLFEDDSFTYTFEKYTKNNILLQS